MLKPFSFIPALALLLAAFSVHAVELPEPYKSKGITIGLVPNYPPLEMRDPANNDLVGFDIDLGNALGKRLGVPIKWQETSFEQLLSGIKTGRIDMVISGMTDLPARQGAATFVNYLRSGVQFFTQDTRKGEFKDREALCGKNVGASRRTSLPTEIRNWSDANCVAKGKPPIQVTGTEGSADARTQLRQGRIDAATQGNETLPYIMTQEPKTFALIGDPIRWTLFGMATPKEQTALQQALVATMKDLVKDGTYKRLLDKWQLSDSGVADFTINGGN